MRGHTSGESVTAAELASAGLLHVGEGSTISGQAAFMPADDQGSVLPVTIGAGCRVGPFAVIHGGTSLADGVRVEEHAVAGKPENGYAVGKIYDGTGTSTIIGAGTVIRAGAIVYAGTRIGSETVIGHHTWLVPLRSALAPVTGADLDALNLFEDDLICLLALYPVGGDVEPGLRSERLRQIRTG